MDTHHDERRSPPLVLAASRLPPDAASAAAARTLVRETLSAALDADTLHTVELLTCEVVTNVIVHARTPCLLRLSEPRAGAVRVEVCDEECSHPPLAAATPDGSARTGRGLALVDAFADAWGTIIEPPGKTVWLEIGTSAAQP